MRQKTVITAEDCTIMLAACHAEAIKQGWKVSIAVVDDGGFLLHLERQDGAPVQSAEIARRKAFSAAVSRMSTKTLEDMAKDGRAFSPFPTDCRCKAACP